MAEEISTLGAVDYVIIGLMLLFSSSIGIYYRFTGGKQKTSKEYLLADGNMPIIPVSLSLVVSFMSAITMLGLSSEIYAFGTMFIISCLGYFIAIPIVVYCYLPVFFRLQATSAYEYLERRFGVATRTATSLTFSFHMILNNSVVLYAPSLALSAVTGISLSGSIIAIGLVCMFYSVLGGMKAILITDAFQSILILVATGTIVIKGTIDAGGINELWRIAQEGGRIDFINFDPDPTVRHTFWSLIIGGMINYLSTYGVHQTQVQRLLTVNSVKKAQSLVWLAWTIHTILLIFITYTGLVAYARFFNCDPVLEGRIDSFDKILPIFVMDTMSHIPGLAGLFTAGVFSAALSTISSTLNSLAAIIMADYVKPLMKFFGRKEMNDKKTTIITQIIATVNGLLCIGLAYVVGGLTGLLQLSLTLTGVAGGPILGVFTLGMFFWGANETGAFVGLLSGLAISMWIGFGGPKPPLPILSLRVDGCKNETFLYHETMTYETMPLAEGDEGYFWPYKISYMWYGTIGFLVTVIVGVAVSYIRQAIKPIKTQEKMDRNLFSPSIFRFLPKDKVTDITPEDSS